MSLKANMSLTMIIVNICSVGSLPRGKHRHFPVPLVCESQFPLCAPGRYRERSGRSKRNKQAGAVKIRSVRASILTEIDELLMECTTGRLLRMQQRPGLAVTTRADTGLHVASAEGWHRRHGCEARARGNWFRSRIVRTVCGRRFLPRPSTTPNGNSGWSLLPQRANAHVVFPRDDDLPIHEWLFINSVGSRCSSRPSDLFSAGNWGEPSAESGRCVGLALEGHRGHVMSK